MVNHKFKCLQSEQLCKLWKEITQGEMLLEKS